MLLKKYFYLVLSIAFLSIGCSTEVEDFTFFENTQEEPQISQTETTDEVEENETATQEPIFEVYINDTLFTAHEIKAQMESDKIHVLATNEDGSQSIFLLFTLATGKRKILGDVMENSDNNIAGHILNDQNVGFMTNAMPQACGEIFLESLDQNQLSGTFDFDACNTQDDVKKFTKGVFKNIALQPN